jgi:hypothetical protein
MTPLDALTTLHRWQEMLGQNSAER